MNEEKRQADMTTDRVQGGNRSWWTSNTMSYDWNDQVASEKFSLSWFDEIDRRFVHASRLFATDHQPFDRIIPFDQLQGKRVLEIGCGMGLHSELISRAGARLTSMDLSPTSVDATTRRLALKGLTAEVIESDAENLPFESNTFDFVWSWGVIHHSSRTAKIVREIARVLKDEGDCRVMVYNREGMAARAVFLTEHVLKRGFLHRTFEETLYRSTDGFSARYYTKEQFEDLFRAYFRDVSAEICGQEADAVPLPSRIRRFVAPLLSLDYLKRAQAQRGAFIFLKASKLLSTP